MIRERDLAREIESGGEAIREPATLFDGVLLIARREATEQTRAVAEQASLEREGDRQAARHEPEGGVEADVVHRARHRFQPDGPGPRLPQPLDATADDRLPQPGALPIGTDGERPHPAFDSGSVRDVEGHDLVTVITPDERAPIGILDGVPPDRGVEKRDANADHAVAAISLAEGIAEDLVQTSDVLEPRRLRSFGLMLGTPRPRGRHQSPAPASSYTSSPLTGGAARSGSSA